MTAAPTPVSSPPFVADPDTALAAPEFRHPAAWSAPAMLAPGPLSAFGGAQPIAGEQPLPHGGPDSTLNLMRAQAAFGMVAAAGDEVAVPVFGAPTGGGPTAPAPLSVQFVDAKTGKVIATHPLPDAAQYYGMDPVSVGGKTDVEVRYAPQAAAASAATALNPQFTSVVLDPTGAQVWSSAGQPIAQPEQPGQPGLVGDRHTGLVHDGGYLERIDNPDPGDRYLKKATISVLDLTGKTVLTVPKATVRSPSDPIKSIQNNLQLAGGYAVFTTVEIPPTPSGGFPQSAFSTLEPVRFTVYDLAHNAKRVADVTEPAVPLGAGPSLGFGVVSATCGSKLLIEWPTVVQGSSATGHSINFAVLDAATGRATSPPITIPTYANGSMPETTLRAASDPACSAALVNGTVGTTRRAMFAVNWANGQAPWKQLGTYPPQGPQNIFEALTLHGGVAYGLQTVGTDIHAATLGLSDGKIRETGFALSPVAFTTAGAPLFLQIDPSAPAPLAYRAVTTPPGATAGQTVTMTTTPPPPPLPTNSQLSASASPGASPPPSSTGSYEMTVWA
ncbi:MAG: hypothetical protein HOW97_20505, partial [Catenulispora sp.]|nr:hypothetical protein [Catenulispora sp.]